MKKRVLIFVFLIVFLVGFVNATDYYVDATGGNDGNDGLTPETAWKTITKVNSMSFNPGDNIYFKRGENWREQLNVPSSGTEGNPITFGAYGNGEKPVIKGSSVLENSDWTLVDPYNYVFRKSLANSPEYNVFVEDGALLVNMTSIVDAESNLGSFYWENGYIYVHPSDSSNPNTNGKLYEYPDRWRCIKISNKNYILIHNFTVEHAKNSGIQAMDGSSFVTIEDCVGRQNGFWGIVWTDTTSNCVGRRLEAYENQRYGGIGHECYGTFIIEHSISHHNGERNSFLGSWRDHGFYVKSDSAENSVLRYNIAYENTAHGFKVGTGSTGVAFAYNIAWNNGRAGYLADGGSSGTNLYNNVDYGSNIGLYIYPNADVNVVKNNVFINSVADGVYVGSGGSITDYSNNDVYGAGLSNYNGMANPTDSNGNIAQDPLFTNPSNNNFHLQPTSPCIDAGTDVGLTQDFDGNPIVGVPDIGAYEYQGMVSMCCPADINTDGVVSMVELMNYISNWKAGSVQMTDLMTAISEWKNGC